LKNKKVDVKVRTWIDSRTVARGDNNNWYGHSCKPDALSITRKTVKDIVVNITVLKVLQNYYNTFLIQYC